MESYVGLRPKVIVLMSSATNAPVDKVDPFHNNHQQPEIDGEVVAIENDGNGEHEDDRDQEGAQGEKPDFIPAHGCVNKPMSSGAYHQITSSISPVPTCSQA